MKALPEGFEAGSLIDLLADGWDLDVETIEDAPHRESEDTPKAYNGLKKTVAIRDQWATLLR